MPWLFVAALLVLWELACVAFSIPQFVLPRPTVVAASLVDRFRTDRREFADDAVAHLLGFAIAVALGVLLGVAIGSSRLVYRGLYPVLVGFNSIPKVAVVPVLVIWFGIGTIPAVLTAFLVSFFPIAVNVATGLATIEPELLDVMRSLGATKSKDPSQGRAAALDAVLLRFAQDRDHARLRRHDHFGDRRGQCRASGT